MELLVEMRRGSDSAYAYYGSFSVADEASQYRVGVQLYDPSSPAGDSLTYHDGMLFSTYDQDNDLHSAANCAQVSQAPFWFNSCYSASPLGKYGTTGTTGIIYSSWSASSPLDAISFKVRERRCIEGNGQSCEKCREGFFLCSSASGFLDCCN